MLDRLSSLIQVHRRRILQATVVATLVAGIVGIDVARHLEPAGFADPRSESARADAQLDRLGARGPDLVVHVVASSGGPRALRARIERVRSVLRAEPIVARVSIALVDERATDGRPAAYVRAVLHQGPGESRRSAAKRIQDELATIPGTVAGGPALFDDQLTDTIEHDFRRAELIALPIIFLLSALFFRGFVAALLPPIVGAVAILGTLFVLRAVSSLVEVSVLSLNVITALGLGLAVDYSLFMVTRYREELARHGPGPAALRATMATAGRTVLFSSLTIAAIMGALLVFPQSLLYSMGLGGLIVALVTSFVSLVILPAVLAALGTRVNALSPRRLRRRAEIESRPLASGVWYRLAAFVTRRAAGLAIAVAAVLLALATPALRAEFVSVDASILPESASVREVHDATARDGSLRRASAVQVLARDVDGRQMDELADRLARLPGAGAVGAARALPGGAFVIGVQSRSGDYAPASGRLVAAIRSDPLAGSLAVTGPAARFADLRSSLVSRLPLALVLVLCTTMLALFLMTGSFVMGAKVVLMNACTLAAVYGLLVLGFQDGLLGPLLAFDGSGALDISVPVLLFAAVFALTTDYGIFLIARVKELVDGGMSNDEAVAAGQERTGRAITAAAALFCVSVGALASSRIVPVQETAVGISLAVAIDATLVRALMMPALMHLLGAWNWWAPAPLRRAHRRFARRASAVA